MPSGSHSTFDRELAYHKKASPIMAFVQDVQPQDNPLATSLVSVCDSPVNLAENIQEQKQPFDEINDTIRWILISLSYHDLLVCSYALLTL